VARLTQESAPASEGGPCSLHFRDRRPHRSAPRLAWCRPTEVRMRVLSPTLLPAVLLVASAATALAQTPPPPPGGGGRGGPPMMMTERKLLDRFDTNKDKKLDLAERNAAREWLATQPQTGPGGGRGGRPPGGPPMGGPPG